jgi:hypothetical protein
MQQKPFELLQFSIAVTLGVSLTLGAACSTTPTQPDTRDLTAVPPASPPANPSSIPPPLRVAVFPDQSGSANWSRTPRVSVEDLQILIAAISERGGELAFGLIRDRSNRGLVRLRIELPPTPPKKPDKNGNAFRKAQEMQAYKAKYAQYQRQYDGWQQDKGARISAFLSTVEPLLALQADARQTDIWNAIARADLFVSERDSSWPLSPRCFIALISDGADNVKARKVTLNNDVTLVLVNGSKSVGSLTALRPVLFESTQAAFRFITNAEGEK